MAAGDSVTASGPIRGQRKGRGALRKTGPKTRKARARRAAQIVPATFDVPHLASLDIANCLDHISKIVARCIGDVAKDVDATAGQLQVIAAVARSTEGLSARQVADALAIRPGSLTGMLDQLEARGAIARRPVPGDGRQFQIVLQEGAEPLIAALIRVDEEIAAHLAPLGSTALGSLGDFAARLEESLRAGADQPLPVSLHQTSPDRIKRPKLDPEREAAFAMSRAELRRGAGEEPVPAAAQAEVELAPTGTTGDAGARGAVAHPQPADEGGTGQRLRRSGMTLASKVISAVDAVRRLRDD